MSMNEIFAPNGPHNKMSLPVTDTADSTAPNDFRAAKVGRPVMVNGIVGVLQTAVETEDGATTGVVNSNAPGHATVWNEGTWRLPVDTTTTAPTIGGIVYARVQSNTDVVKLYSKDKVHGFPFGVFMEAAPAGATVKDLAVRVFQYAGEDSGS